ncbi:transcription factor bHLH51 [Corylus avellana]|uniref:transcription factor bHLH51 n=1 Tax=Corylus avellana TaxID=13451 RepID=UPI001E22E6FB|nr:transcription factor bHLH51 [Corylus avellana]
MENCYYSAWPEGEENWAHAAVLNDESPYLVPWPLPPHVSASTSSRFQFHGFPSEGGGVAEDGGATPSKSHSQAEKRRRDRINAQLATLRKLIPKSDKMDKAALLGRVIEHVKDLKRKAMEVSKSCSLPTEVDEVTIDSDHAQDVNLPSLEKGEHNIFIRASFCCDDRPELFPELIQVLKSLRLTAVKADMASVGGRIKSTLVLCTKESDEAGVSLSTLKRSLKLVLSKLASSPMASNCRIRSKRQRFFLPSYYSQ